MKSDYDRDTFILDSIRLCLAFGWGLMAILASLWIANVWVSITTLLAGMAWIGYMITVCQPREVEGGT